MEEISSYPSIHPPCEVFLHRVGTRSCDEDDEDHDHLSSQSPLSSPPNSPYQISPFSEDPLMIDPEARNSNVSSSGPIPQVTITPSREPAPFDEEPAASKQHRLHSIRSDLTIPSDDPGVSSDPLTFRARRIQDHFVEMKISISQSTQKSVLPFEDEQGNNAASRMGVLGHEGPDDEKSMHNSMDEIDIPMAPTDEGCGFMGQPRSLCDQELYDEVSSLDGKPCGHTSSPSTTQDATNTENDTLGDDPPSLWIPNPNTVHDRAFTKSTPQEPLPRTGQVPELEPLRQSGTDETPCELDVIPDISTCKELIQDPNRPNLDTPSCTTTIEARSQASSLNLLVPSQQDYDEPTGDDPSLNLNLMSESTYDEDEISRVDYCAQIGDLHSAISVVRREVEVTTHSLTKRSVSSSARVVTPQAQAHALTQESEEKRPGQGTRKAWWVEEELAKREKYRELRGSELNVAERIVELGATRDASLNSSPCSRAQHSIESELESTSSTSRSRRAVQVERRADQKADPDSSIDLVEPTSSPERLSIVGLATHPSSNCTYLQPAESAKSEVKHIDGVGSESTDKMIENLNELVGGMKIHSPSAGTTDNSVNEEVIRRKHRKASAGTHDPLSVAINTNHNLDPLIASDGDSMHEAAKPVLVKPLDSDIGIPKGDVMLSLLNKGSDWSANVQEAVWRCRTMRRNCDTRWLHEKAELRPGLPSKGRTSVQVDVDDVRVSGGVQSVVATQNAAIEHLKYDDFDDALSLYDDILQSYNTFFEQKFEQLRSKSPSHRQQDVSNYKLFVGMALHNLGIIHLLKGEYQDALTYFERATLNRATSPGTGHPDHISSLVKMALCHFALEDFKSAQAELEEALEYLRQKKASMAEYRQFAEVLNNLGCLSYMCGRTDTAIVYLEESLDQQGYIADNALYAGSRFSCHNGTLNASITKVNLGLLALATGDATMSITAFEAALRDQQLLLRDAHTTLLATIDYLVIANLVSGKKEKAVQLLKRMLHMQMDAFGPDDARCLATGEKIAGLQLEATSSARDSHVKTENKPEIVPLASPGNQSHAGNKFRPFASLRKRQYKAM